MHRGVTGRRRRRAGALVFLAALAVAPRARALPEYPGALVFPTTCTSKCTVGRSAAVQYIVLGVAESSWDAAVAAFQSDPGKSVQYIVGADGRVGQFIAEEDTPFFAGNAYYNSRAIGIVLEGFVATPSLPEAQYQTTAALVGYLLGKYHLPADRAHVIGLDQVPNGNQIPEDSPPCGDGPATCEQSADYGGSSSNRSPGVHFDWCGFMHQVGGTCVCLDVGVMLTCSADMTMAFRCMNGILDAQTCDGAAGCEPGTGGADALCHAALTTTTTPASSSTTTTLVGRAACLALDGPAALRCLDEQGLAGDECRVPKTLSMSYEHALRTMERALERGPGRTATKLARAAIARLAAVEHQATRSRAVHKLSPDCRAAIQSTSADALARARTLAAGL